MTLDMVLEAVLGHVTHAMMRATARGTTCLAATTPCHGATTPVMTHSMVVRLCQDTWCMPYLDFDPDALTRFRIMVYC
ncbi:hypothetical protein CK203_117576 [Vitis vinifera]|uniref:Uncharacterized protein n=1 Tax=Vitis vinifera TaxID=29760 RepID=A0A438BNU2_VITVI|nr:hypothetical protein CK203_117576 [Vitis vinifera]